MKPDCIHCSGRLRLVSDDGPNYSWRCESGCAERIDTGIPTSTSIASFERHTISDDKLTTSQLICPQPPEYVSGIRVYMPQILYHVIECTWFACYHHVYQYCIAPYLDSTEVVDYVLRTPVVYASSDARRGSTGALIYGELYHRLHSVSCPKIADYLRRTFDEHEQLINK